MRILSPDQFIIEMKPKWSRHFPLTEALRGSSPCISSKLQRDRSSTAEQETFNLLVESSNLSGPTNLNNTPIAQWTEHLTTNQEVAGSNPARGTTFTPRKWMQLSLLSSKVLGSNPRWGTKSKCYMLQPICQEYIIFK